MEKTNTPFNELPFLPFTNEKNSIKLLSNPSAAMTEEAILAIMRNNPHLIARCVQENRDLVARILADSSASPFCQSLLSASTSPSNQSILSISTSSSTREIPSLGDNLFKNNSTVVLTTLPQDKITQYRKSALELLTEIMRELEGSSFPKEILIAMGCLGYCRATEIPKEFSSNSPNTRKILIALWFPQEVDEIQYNTQELEFFHQENIAVFSFNVYNWSLDFTSYSNKKNLRDLKRLLRF